MAVNLTDQVRSISEVTKAVANGDLSRTVNVDVQGEMLDLKETVNGMTESLSLFADEVTRVAKEVGTEGLLGGQAQVTNVGGTWKELTDNVNVMAANVSFRFFPVPFLLRSGDVSWIKKNHRFSMIKSFSFFPLLYTYHFPSNVLVLVPQATGDSVVRAGEETLRESQSRL